VTDVEETDSVDVTGVVLSVDITDVADVVESEGIIEVTSVEETLVIDGLDDVLPLDVDVTGEVEGAEIIGVTKVVAAVDARGIVGAVDVELPLFSVTIMLVVEAGMVIAELTV
jgi:hypothetical protein